MWRLFTSRHHPLYGIAQNKGAQRTEALPATNSGGSRAICTAPPSRLLIWRARLNASAP
jgi:hypothetical protein